MKIFTVYTKNHTNIDDAIFIKEGFNIIAFIFQMFWALYNRLWQLAILLLLISLTLNILVTYELLSNYVQVIVNTMISVLIGFEANDLVRESLLKRGYNFVTIVAAPNLDAARLRFFENI